MPDQTPQWVVDSRDIPPSVVSGSSSGGVPAWVTATAYTVNQLVQNAGVVYICLANHTSGGSFSGVGVNWAVLGGTAVEIASPRTAIASIGASRGQTFSGAGAITETVERRLMVLPVGVTQFRLRLSNYSMSLEGGSLGTGTINLAGFYVGLPAYPAAGRWVGACNGAPTLIDSANGLALNTFGDMYVSPWITPATIGLSGSAFQRGTPIVLSLGCSGGSAGCRQTYTNTGGTYKFWNSGAGVAAGAALAAAPGGLQTISMFDWRIEYQYRTDNQDPVPNVLVIGDSITEGHVNNTSPFADFAHNFETWPGAAALRNHFSVFNSGLDSSTAYNPASGTNQWDPTTSTPATQWRWQRTGLVPAGGYVNAPAAITYDKAIISLGTNDFGAGSGPTLVQPAILNIANYLRANGVSEIYVATVIPRNFPANPSEGYRTSYNSWCRTMTHGLDGVVDLDKVIALPPAPVTTTSTLTSGVNPITVASGTGIFVGQSVLVLPGSTGTLPVGVTVTTVSGTTITLSAAPSGSGAATLLFSGDSPYGDPDLLFDYPHPSFGGYQRMAYAVGLR